MRGKNKSRNTQDATALDVAGTYAQASALLGLPKAAFTWAAGEGCKAIRGSRVHLEQFKIWWAENSKRMQDVSDLPTKDVLDRLIKKQKFDRGVKEDEREERKWIRADEAAKEQRAIAIEISGFLQRMENEMPAKLVGLDVISMREKFERFNDSAYKIFGGSREDSAYWNYEGVV
jgi:hypothetical protein